MSDIKLSDCLFIDLQTDEQRRDWFLLGRGVETGIIAPALQPHLTTAYNKIVESKKLIEQQHARITKLEASEHKYLEEISDQIDKINALVATVERLYEAGTKLRDDIDLSKIVGAGKRNFANEWYAAVSSTPQQNLNAVKRDAFIEGFNAGFSDCWITDGEEHAEVAVEVANQRYPSDKDGE